MAIPQLRAFGPSIKDHADPTFNLYFPLLAAQVDAGALLEPTENRYGPLERHAYDVYLPPGDKDGKGKLKTIVFVHGGGMVQGDKQIPESKGGAHRNIGTFFANRGFLVVRPPLVPLPPFSVISTSLTSPPPTDHPKLPPSVPQPHPPPLLHTKQRPIPLGRDRHRPPPPPHLLSGMPRLPTHLPLTTNDHRQLRRRMPRRYIPLP